MKTQFLLIFAINLFLSVTCDLNKNDGYPCEWDGVKGTCVDIHRCFTSLDKKNPKQPVCSQKGQEKIICCTDCELVNDTRNAVITPNVKVLWKNGKNKAWDKCLQYVTDLPYECYTYGGIERSLDKQKKCHRYGMWGVGGSPPLGGPARSNYPHMAMLRYGPGEGSTDYQCAGAIISEKYILTAADCLKKGDGVKEIVVGMVTLSEAPSNWQVRRVARALPHPAAQPPYHQHNIALLEIDTPLTFNGNVLPACLHFDEFYDDFGYVPTWKDEQGKNDLVYPMRELSLKLHSSESCSTDQSYNETVHVCYGSGDNGANDPCKNLGGEPLIGTSNHISSCTHTILGVTSSPPPHCQPKASAMYAKLAYYLPWIESIVWP